MKRRTPRTLLTSLIALLMPAAAITALTLAAPAGAADPQPGAVSVPGSFGSEVGCPGDWQPDCDQVQLTRRANDGVWSRTLALPAGSYEYKAALDKSWDVNYGKGGVQGGPNIAITVPAGGKNVTFYYDNATHWVTDDLNTPIVTAAGSFQSELGCPADWSPDCLASWLQDPDGDGTYTFTTTAIPPGNYEVKATVGLSWDVNYGAGGVPGGANIPFEVSAAGESITFSFDSASHLLTVLAGAAASVDLTTPTAYWLSRHYIGWALGAAAADRSYRLYYSRTGGLGVDEAGVTGGNYLPLSYDPNGLPAALRAKFPAQAALGALGIPDSYLGLLPSILTGQVAVAAFDSAGTLVDGAGLQIPGVLDDLYAGAAHRRLGIGWTRSGRPNLALWAPTAQDVSVLVYPDATGATPLARIRLARDHDGVWSVTGPRGWRGDYYLFEISVYVPETGKVEHNLVTDPYSVGLSANSTRSLLVNLSDPALKPAGWTRLAKPALPIPEYQSITELHVRDFSIGDPTVPAADRGTFRAFTDTSSNAVQHLRSLARAGLTTVHLLPSFDFATRSVNEDKSAWQNPPCDLASYPPDSDQQQACTTSVADTDGYNWGYDPMHYTVPEGSYATDPNGAARTREFRAMVAALNRQHLRVVLDVVYNHTADAGQSGTNDLDRIVPGYYHRLNATGNVETSTCCPNTATEHTMMGKLVVDSVVTWAKQYKLDGFRFDLMGHHPKQNILDVRAALNRLTMAKDGVDGRKIYLYGEGWDFGEVAGNALFVNATQVNMAGTGIGTFNDRLRDAVRGGGPFDTNPRIQGFGSGQYTDPNGDPVNGDAAARKATLLHDEDLVKVGLAGNLRDYRFVDAAGQTVTGAGVDYNGQPAGYTADPAEAITYVDAHDGQSLFDTLALKLPQPTSMADRIRMQTLSLATTALSQGVSFWQAGTENLRSKSFDSNSYNSGDWFNVLDWSYATNGFGRGLPPAASNSAMWPYFKPLLADPALQPARADILSALGQSETLLRLRKSTPLFHLGTAALIQQKLSFPNSGPGATPGVITMRIDDTVGADVDRHLSGLVVVFNATPQATTQTVSALAGRHYALDPIQAGGTDRVVRTARFDSATGTFTVPGRTVAVFVARQH
ncbi:pullulanase-type alpha-1,6-glucosidase [Jatrophihabitans sp.]|uniref:pullulanase-type alpha-1,6-glucosidase n=1 Tax=Jatrophihabitans sp. TaxID=1932789 RepID=UPI002C7178F9|nr:pullulanase-type alpha-1,6-glucosidase [Jatrophihabitans sp.]